MESVLCAEETADDGLYHLATGAQRRLYLDSGVIAPASLDSEGFIHCSWGRQVASTAARHFPGVEDLVAIRLDPGALGAELVEEDTAGRGEAFPHVYGPIPVSAVIEMVAL